MTVGWRRVPLFVVGWIGIVVERAEFGVVGMFLGLVVGL